MRARAPPPSPPRPRRHRPSRAPPVRPHRRRPPLLLPALVAPEPSPAAGVEAAREEKLPRRQRRHGPLPRPAAGTASMLLARHKSRRSADRHHAALHCPPLSRTLRWPPHCSRARFAGPRRPPHHNGRPACHRSPPCPRRRPPAACPPATERAGSHRHSPGTGDGALDWRESSRHAIRHDARPGQSRHDAWGRGDASLQSGWGRAWGRRGSCMLEVVALGHDCGG